MRAPYRLEFRLPGLPKTTNAKRRFGHWAQYARESRVWKDKVIPYVTSLKPPAPLTKVTLTLTRGSSVEPDYDGLVSTFKHVVDALVIAGIIVSDKPSVTGEWKCRWEYSPRGEGFFRVIVEEEVAGG